MTLYIVRANLKNNLSGLRKELATSETATIWTNTHCGLENSSFDNVTGYVMWVEEDY